MADPAPHDMIACPYNMAHQVEHYRMHVHLQKCRKQYRGGGKATCPFDATHVVNDVELDYHVTSCPKRHMLDRQLYLVEDESMYRPKVNVSAPPAAADPSPASENWEEDEFHTPYVPDPTKKGAHILHKIKGATPSERRKARMEGVRTFRPLE